MNAPARRCWSSRTTTSRHCRRRPGVREREARRAQARRHRVAGPVPAWITLATLRSTLVHDRTWSRPRSSPSKAPPTRATSTASCSPARATRPSAPRQHQGVPENYAGQPQSTAYSGFNDMVTPSWRPTTVISAQRHPSAAAGDRAWPAHHGGAGPGEFGPAGPSTAPPDRGAHRFPPVIGARARHGRLPCCAIRLRAQGLQLG